MTPRPSAVRTQPNAAVAVEPAMTVQAGNRVTCRSAAPARLEQRGPAERALPRQGPLLVLPIDGEQPERQSRDLVGWLLAILGSDPDVIFQAQLAVQELAANARGHAPPPRELHVTVNVDSVKIAVIDADPNYEAIARLLAAAADDRQPERDDSALSESGRGLRIVAALFPGACGAEPAGARSRSGQGKQVWISVRRPT